MLKFPAWKIWAVAIVCGLGALFAAPNLLGSGSLPAWPPLKRISLGLDLSGGAHLLLQVDEGVYLADRLGSVEQDVRRRLRSQRIGVRVTASGEGELSFVLRDVADVAAAREELVEIAEDVVVAVGDDGRIAVAMTPEGLTAGLSDAVERTLEVLRNRIDPEGVLEPAIARQGRDRILVQVPGIENTQTLRDRLGQTAKLTFHLVDSEADYRAAQAGALPIGSVLLPSNDPGGPESYVVRAESLVSGENLENAVGSFDQGRPVVAFSFDSVGAGHFCDVTTDNVGRLLAIVLDGRVISAPRINGPICQGNGIITGSFSVRETEELAILLRAGALPVPLTVVEERTVGPTLGADSIRAGRIAAAIGFVAVVVFMAVCYGRFGLFANAALIMNLVLIVGALSLLQATLTLPGIAGIVLTVGMAVDANVLIFERIREEAGHGRTPFNAVETGFRRAMTTILDANITTAVAAFLLFFLGSGPVRGFGATLAIGIITSMFTAIMLTRMLVYLWLRRARPQALPL